MDNNHTEKNVDAFLNQFLTWQEQLSKGQVDQVLAEVSSALIENPTNRDLLYLQAVGYRLKKNIDQALNALKILEEFYPQYPRLYQERGHCYVYLKNAEKAIASFEKAVNLNMCLPASWNALLALYRMTKNHKAEAHARSQINLLNNLPSEVVTAFSMYSDGEVVLAEDTIRKFLLKNGNHIEAMRLLAKIGVDMNVTDDAELLLSSILKINPSHETARYEYATVLLKQHKHQKALDELNYLLGISPSNHAFRITQASVYSGMGQYERAIPQFLDLIKKDPVNPELYLAVGHAYKTKGDINLAIEAYQKATKLRPSMGEAFWSLANLKTYRFNDDEINTMKMYATNTSLGEEDKFHMHFALGKALEDRKEYQVSFENYAIGNSIKRKKSRYTSSLIERNVVLQKSICNKEFFETRHSYGCSKAGPIFIVGLPRSGSTLIEQILASHSKIEGTMELAEIPRLVAELQGRSVLDEEPRYPKVLEDLSAEMCKEFGERYLEETRLYRAGNEYFIDKMPNNFRHLGIIHLILPNAKIIDARRSPLDCCFSNFKQLFAQGQEFTYSFDDIARYYASYLDIMEHWKSVMPNSILTVENEVLIDDFDHHVARILGFLGLEVEKSCFEFYKSNRKVHTASSEQVRRPINKDGVGQWKHYEQWLQPLESALIAAGVKFNK
jgi:tetratricopeptide (TPR) repeat protein